MHNWQKYAKFRAYGISAIGILCILFQACTSSSHTGRKNAAFQETIASPVQLARPDTAGNTPPMAGGFLADSLPGTGVNGGSPCLLRDTIQPDSASSASSGFTDDEALVKQSSTIEDVLDYTAVDSVYVNMKTRIAYLYSEAEVNYTGFNLEANYMEINLPKSEILAQPTKDSTGMEIGIPHF